MNLLLSFLFDRYMHSPKSWLHEIKSCSKTYLFFIYLYISLYIDSKYIIISLLCNIIILIYLRNIKNNYKKFILQILLIPSIIIYNQILSTQLQIKNSFYTKYIYTCFSYIYHENILSIRIFLIFIHYFFIIHILFITTIYEEVMFCFFNFLIDCKNYTINRIAFISIFSLQALESIIIKINRIIITIQKKRITKLFKYYIYIYFISKLIEDIYKDTYKISSVLYSRELNDKLVYINIYK
uniref:Uncharacterized protein n=1 Tax=Hydropuntia rangiferina TaxID=338881 RepID=A0A345U8C5_9FLOR|nr:hypothetical protein [Hydropuntia rangiferina]AXI96711.1 hypothetical protein [Hydropuntia rangiferina]UAD87394.1 hypothetical protein [Hydropuntia rangiferina]